jgi:hypothetical protein
MKNHIPNFNEFLDGNNLILNPTSDSDMTTKEFVEDIEYDEVRTYKFKVKEKTTAKGGLVGNTKQNAKPTA